MEDKSLADKAINLKGKQYVLVSDRVLYFNETYEQGCIQTELESFEGGRFIVRARVFPEGMEGRCFTGYSQATMGGAGANKDAALENAETSAVGRALAFMGIGVIESIASADEVRKATAPQTPKMAPQAIKPPATAPRLTQRQEAAKDRIKALLGILGEKNDTVAEVSEAVLRLTGMQLQIANFDAIGEKLAGLSDKVDSLI